MLASERGVVVLQEETHQGEGRDGKEHRWIDALEHRATSHRGLTESVRAAVPLGGRRVRAGLLSPWARLVRQVETLALVCENSN